MADETNGLDPTTSGTDAASGAVAAAPAPAPAPTPAPAVAPAAPVTVAPVTVAPVTVATAAAATPRKVHRTRGLIAQIAAILGIVVSLALIGGVWYGRAYVVDGIEQVSGRLDNGLGRGATAAQQVSGGVSSIAAILGDITTKAQAVAADSSATVDSLRPLSAVTSAVVDRYGQFRASYASLKETITTTLDTLSRLDRLIPGFTIPQGPVDALAAVDQKVQDLDATISQIANADIVAGKVSDVANAIAARTGQAAANLNTISASISAIGDRATALRTEVKNAVDRAGLLLLGGGILMTLMLLYSVFLNLVLFNAGRRWRRGDPAP